MGSNVSREQEQKRLQEQNRPQEQNRLQEQKRLRRERLRRERLQEQERLQKQERLQEQERLRSTNVTEICYDPNDTTLNFAEDDEHDFPHGLINQGSTCYLNSVLQVLFMTPEFHTELQPLNQTDVVLKELFKELKEKECRTEKITEHLEIKEVGRQRDAAQYLELILNKMSPEASETFRLELTDKTECSKGHCIIEEPSLFWTLPLPLSGINSVTTAFNRMFTERTFHVYCNDCGKDTNAKSKYKMTKPPQVLVLLLKRFDLNNKSYSKSAHKVELSETLEIKGQSYSLCGVVDHSGSLSGGHYTATIQSRKNQTWYCFNDKDVTETKGQMDQRSSTAYLLIYRGHKGPTCNEREEDSQIQQTEKKKRKSEKDDKKNRKKMEEKEKKKEVNMEKQKRKKEEKKKKKKK